MENDMEEFDALVDQLLEGDSLYADFDSGITIVAGVDFLSLTYDDGDTVFDINLDSDEVDVLHLMLEAVFVAQKGIKDVNWDSFLEGIADGD